MIWIGRFDQQYNPHLDFTLVSQRGDRQEFDGIIDTGFTGFVQIPLISAVVMGMISNPISTGAVNLANGTTQQVWLKQTIVEVHGEAVTGVCQIPQTNNSPILIGMDFLRRFERALVVSSNLGVVLIKEQDIPSV